MDRKVLSDTSLDTKITALFINLSCSGKRKKGKIMIFDNWLKYSDIKSSWSKYEKTSMFMPWFISQYSIRGVQTPKLPQHHHCYALKLGPWIYCFKIKITSSDQILIREHWIITPPPWHFHPIHPYTYSTIMLHPSKTAFFIYCNCYMR